MSLFADKITEFMPDRNGAPHSTLPRSAFLGSLALGALWPRCGAAQSPIPLRASSAIDDAATPYLYAMESGLFRTNGFDATLERATSGAAVASGVVGGSFDVGKSSVISLLSAHARGLPLVVIAPAGEYDISNPTAAIAVRTDAPIHSGADFNGKIVAVSAINDSFSLSMRAWVDAHGGDSATLKLIELPMSAAPVAISSGRIDAAVLAQPFLRQALEGGSVRIVGDPVSALGNHHTDSAWFTTIAFTQKSPEVVGRFMRTMREAAAYVNGHHSETAYLLAKFAMVQTSDVMRMRVLQGTRLEPANVQILIDAAARYKIIPERFDARDLIYQNALH
jgi:NitT/TauT family transport system substrate-binding protein